MNFTHKQLTITTNRCGLLGFSNLCKHCLRRRYSDKINVFHQKSIGNLAHQLNCLATGLFVTQLVIFQKKIVTMNKQKFETIGQKIFFSNDNSKQLASGVDC